MPTRRPERTGRRPVIAAPILLALTGTSAVFTIALVAGSDGSWSPIHFIFIAVTIAAAILAWNRFSHGRQSKPLRAELSAVLEAQFASEPSPRPAPATAPAAKVSMTGTIEGTDITVEVGQPAVS